MPRKCRRVCFVTGTRAEFGLMQSTLRALRDHPDLELQIIATGLHTQPQHRPMLEELRRSWKLNALASWKADSSPGGIARAMGSVTAKLVDQFEKLRSEIVLVVGDRVEAFAAASAAHVSGRIVAHVHGGDRAMGEVDDALRHAITKLAHIHFPATKHSAERLFKLGEEQWRITVAGAPGNDGIREDALRAPQLGRSLPRLIGTLSDYVVVLLHPTDADEKSEFKRASLLLNAVKRKFESRVIALMPNSDPGSAGVARALNAAASRGDLLLLQHADRPIFLGLLRDCRVLIGNSSSGIIEAGSFGTPVLDVGPRQFGRERGPNVLHVEWSDDLARAVDNVGSRRRTRPADNPYGRGGAGQRIARRLASIQFDERLRRKVIRY